MIDEVLPWKQRIAFGIAALFVGIYLTGAFFSACVGILDFTAYLCHFIGSGFDFELANLRTELDPHSDRTFRMMGILMIGIPIGLAGLVASLRGWNIFSRRNWFGKR